MKMISLSRRVSIPVLLAVFASVFLTGCGTPFKYNPKHDQQYSGVTRDGAIAIVAGEDARLKKEKRPKWKPSAEEIVAGALADELTHAKLFQTVSIDLKKQPAAVENAVYAVSFRVTKLQLFNDYTGGEVAGGAALGLLGVPGVLIAASIPTKFVSDAEVEFTVHEVATKQVVLTKCYAATRSCSQNAYKGMNPLLQQTSDVLEEVVKSFVADLSAIPASAVSPQAAK